MFENVQPLQSAKPHYTLDKHICVQSLTDTDWYTIPNLNLVMQAKSTG